MDLLVSTPLSICGEVVLRVRQNLMARDAVPPASFQRVSRMLVMCCGGGT